MAGASRQRLTRWLDARWYGNSPMGLLLAPLSWLYCTAGTLRRLAYRLHLRKTRHPGVPVIVVGNITVGGTGKTPLVIWLVQRLRGAGYAPAVVSRGYGGRAARWPQQARADSDPGVVGDEPVLIASRTGCPVAVAPDRGAAAASLVEYTSCDIIVADDGLQHYGLGRDLEIAVIDGVRRLGNGRCLPAGPLRESPRRLRRVDFIVANGLAGEGETGMQLAAAPMRNLRDEGATADRHQFTGGPVHAVAGIGCPARFFDQLRGMGLRVVEHAFPDHHPFKPADLDFGDGAPVIMTEKDAVKCRHFAQGHHWYLPVEARMDETFARTLLARINEIAAAYRDRGARA
ncbi:MAG TPA: tetraacyldisaccharide 4'-kinase [Gammaproteobacteria bacterium]|nr:tetraacyldisaccharide 4'-kinase [Gammaproteobacteria bacterium]